MQRFVRATRTVFALLVACGLGFGATAAFAETEARRCFGDAIGTCSTMAGCRADCEAAGGIPGSGVCSNGCCYCAF
jgi:hypothetical protein